MGDLKSGYGIQVISPADDHTFVLNDKAVEELLLTEDICDRAAVVISVAGAFRKGKSFLLDFFLRYMHHKYVRNESGDWLGPDDEPLHGFSWRGGSERDTTGLLLWSQPFKATLENGQKVVIFLMDTQGTFDSESTVRDNATVFALSTMLSSVQIYNLSQNIEEDDLQHLQLFTDYGRLALESCTGKPFQRLQLLVRDWSFPYEHPFGVEGGASLLSKRLMIHKGQHHELQFLRKHVDGCFEELTCFLMPHPGLKVATNQNFEGKLTEIGAEFKQSLRQLVPMLLAPQNLVPKVIGGQLVKAKDLLLYFKSYMNIFNGTDLPEPKTILEATAEANNLLAVSDAREIYETIMDEVAGGYKPFVEPQLLEDEHKWAKDKALYAFHSKKKMGSTELAEIYSSKLITGLDEQYERYRLHNEGKSLLRKMGAPVVLVTLAMLGFALSFVGTLLTLDGLALLGQWMFAASVILLIAWFYSRATGNMAEQCRHMDLIADQLIQLTRQQVGRQAVAVAVPATTEKKQA